MAFSFNTPRKLSSEEASPMQALISRAMETFDKGVKLSYLPREKEASLFAKEIGPLAGLASSPNFTGFNPQIQKMIAQKIGAYLGGSQGGSSDNMGQDETTPGYAEDADIYSRLSAGAHNAYGKGGQSKTAASRLAGTAEQFGLPDIISQTLGGHGRADQDAAFQQAIEEGVNRLKLKGYSESSARNHLARRNGESDTSYIARTKPLFIGESKEQKESPPRSIEEKMASDNSERANAEHTAKIYKTTPEVVLEAQSMGVKNAKEFKEFLKWRNANG